jgi:hypothetical protein
MPHTGIAQSLKPPTFEELAIEEMAREVRTRGLASVARELRIPRQTLGGVICGACREGSRELALMRWRERSGRPSGGRGK